jgi:type I restriction-modification system DNA methylase subunit
MNSATIVQKLWNYCNVRRDDGMSYGDYVEQLTYLLFLKMADERSRPPHNQASPRTRGYDWPALLAKDGDELFHHYRHTLEKLGTEKGTIGLIFAKAQNKFQDPAELRRLVVDLIDAENWSAMGADVKGDAYEGLLEKNAQDTKSGAGPYFTPRPLIQAMVDCIAPRPKRPIDRNSSSSNKELQRCPHHAKSCSSLPTNGVPNACRRSGIQSSRRRISMRWRRTACCSSAISRSRRPAARRARACRPGCI